MKKARHGTTRKRKPGLGRQRGGIAPFLAADIPALVAGGKAAARVDQVRQRIMEQ